MITGHGNLANVKHNESLFKNSLFMEHGLFSPNLSSKQPNQIYRIWNCTIFLESLCKDEIKKMKHVEYYQQFWVQSSATMCLKIYHMHFETF